MNSPKLPDQQFRAIRRDVGQLNVIEVRVNGELFLHPRWTLPQSSIPSFSAS